MSRFRYLVGYAFNNGQELGRIDINSPVPIQSLQDVQVLENDLRIQVGEPDAFVLSFSLYYGPARW